DVEVSLGKIDSTQISQVQVELWYQDTVNGFEARKTIALKPGDAGVHWRVRLSNRSQNSYRHQLLYFLTDRLRYQTDWQTSNDPALVVNDPFQNAVKVRMVPLLDTNNLVEADVNVIYEEPASGYRRTVQKIFTGGTPLTSQELSIPTLSKQPEGFTYDVTLVR